MSGGGGSTGSGVGLGLVSGVGVGLGPAESTETFPGSDSKSVREQFSKNTERDATVINKNVRVNLVLAI